MAKIVIVGDGPGGLSAALFLAKNGHEAVVYGLDQTAMHYAELQNYLGIEKIGGSEFQEIARRQVTAKGAKIVDAGVEAVTASSAGFILSIEGGDTDQADYLVLSEGRNPVLAKSLGLDEDEEGNIRVGRDGTTSLDRVYVVGRSARPRRSQAIISAGAGAAAALDILAREEGKDVQDWDSPPKD